MGSRAQDEEAAMPAPKNERERRLFELRMKMNSSRTKNSKEVIEEQKRESDPDYSKKQAEFRHKRALGEDGKEGDKKDDKDEDKPKLNALPKGKDYLNDTVEKCEIKDAKKKKNTPA